MTETAHSKAPRGFHVPFGPELKGIFVKSAAHTRIGFIGAGRVANALAPALELAGFTISAIASRSEMSSARLASRLQGAISVATAQDVVDTCDLVFLTVPDNATRDLAATINWQAGGAVVHTSGALSREALAAAEAQGAATGSLHPLQTFAGPAFSNAAEQNLKGIVFALEAKTALRDTLLALVEALGGSVIELRPEDRVLYHASAVLVSNYVITLVKLASDLWQRLDRDQAAAVQALLPLLKATVANIETTPLKDALTGPVARGDLGTIESHLAALAEESPETEEIYRVLAGKTVPLALEQSGLTSEDAESLRQLLRSARLESADARQVAAQK